jgi:hypothetical protein
MLFMKDGGRDSPLKKFEPPDLWREWRLESLFCRYQTYNSVRTTPLPVSRSYT